MLKNEMTEKQLEDRSVIVNLLSAAGWTGTAFNILFERGEPVAYEAHMNYRSKTAESAASYEAKTDTLYFGVGIADEGQIDIAIHFSDKLKEVLNTIISFQASISSANYKSCIKQILAVCPSVDALLGEEGELVVPIIDSDLGSVDALSDEEGTDTDLVSVGRILDALLGEEGERVDLIIDTDLSSEEENE